MAEPAADNMIVTIDGPAGSGKSTVARRLACKLGVDFLDTGAMYRAVAAETLDREIDPADFDAVAELADQLNIRFNWSDDPPSLKVDGRDVTHRLRDADTTRAVSDIAQNGAVRRILVRAQRWIGGHHPRLVTEGRDQGSVVFKNAAVKFYLDARADVRAHRRATELQAAGKQVDEAVILQQIIYRDERDKSRSDGPLICPPDAITVDTSDMTLDQVVDTLHRHVVERVGQPEGATS
jgi:cytidylate kinase